MKTLLLAAGLAVLVPAVVGAQYDPGYVQQYNQQQQSMYEWQLHSYLEQQQGSPPLPPAYLPAPIPSGRGGAEPLEFPMPTWGGMR